MLGYSCPSSVCNIWHYRVNVFSFLWQGLCITHVLSVIPSGCAAVLWSSLQGIRWSWWCSWCGSVESRPSRSAAWPSAPAMACELPEDFKTCQVAHQIKNVECVRNVYERTIIALFFYYIRIFKKINIHFNIYQDFQWITTSMLVCSHTKLS